MITMAFPKFKVPLIRYTRRLILLSVGLLALLAAFASLPFEVGWLSQARWAARAIVAAGVLIGVLGTFTGASIRDFGPWIKRRLGPAPRPVQWFAFLTSGALFLGVAALPAGLVLTGHHTVPATVLKQIAEVGTGRKTSPTQMELDSSGAFWFRDDQTDTLGRASSATTNVKIELPSALTAPDEDLRIDDFATFGTSAGVVYTGDQDRFATYDSGGRLTGLYTIPGAQRVVADPRGHLWVASVAGTSEHVAYVTEIDPVTRALHRFAFPSLTAAPDRIDVQIDGQGGIWLSTLSQSHPKDIGIWTLRNGVISAFAYRQPKLRYSLFFPDFVIDHQGVLWFPVISDLMAVPPRGASRVMHLNPIGDLMDLTPARTGGVLALMTSRSEVVDTDESPDRTYVVPVPSMSTKEFPPYYPLGSGTTDRSVPFGAYGQIIAGRERDFAVSFPALHAIIRFPEGVLTPKPIISGPVTSEIDQLGRSILPKPYTRADIDAPTPTISANEWRGYLVRDSGEAEQALKALPRLSVRLPPEAGPAVDSLRVALEEQQKAMRRRIASGKLATGTYIASFTAKVLGETTIAVNGLRQLAGLPRLDFDRNTVWDAARHMDAE